MTANWSAEWRIFFRGTQWRDHGVGGQAAQDGSELYYLALDSSMMSASALSCGNSTMADVLVRLQQENSARIAPSSDALERFGLFVWWDEITPADASWRQTILRSLDLARCVVVVWSTLSVSASGEFVQEEADRARSRQVLLPIRIEDVMEPLRFGSAQSVGRSNRMPRRHSDSPASHWTACTRSIRARSRTS